MLRSPIKWVGGKSRLRHKIISLLPPHDCYVEVFGGAAWVLLAKETSKVEIFNDIDGELVNFFRVVKENPDEFLKSFKWELVSREEFDRLKNLPLEGLDPVQRAHRFYYIIMASWGGEFGSPRFQTSVNDGGHGNRLIGAFEHLEQRIKPVHERLKSVIIEHLDWQDCIDRYDRENVIMFLDPPYPGNNCNYQFNMRDIKDHQLIADKLKTLKAKFLLTTYNLPESRDLFKNFYTLDVNFQSGMPQNLNRINQELIVANFPLSKAE